MNMPSRVLQAVAVPLLLLLSALPGFAGDYEKGITAYKRGHYTDAAALLNPLAQAGDPLAQFALAVMHDDGRGMTQNFSRALSWYKKSAHNGLVDAQYMVGRLYGRGRGAAQDPSAAFFWFTIARAGGHPDAARLSDQQRSQISQAEQRRVEAKAASWLEKHPRQFTCKRRPCIHPKWLAAPRWEIFGNPDIAPAE
jgi:TPR repeat protein